MDHTLTHHSQTSLLLTSSLSSGVPVPHGIQCMWVVVPLSLSYRQISGRNLKSTVIPGVWKTDHLLFVKSIRQDFTNNRWSVSLGMWGGNLFFQIEQLLLVRRFLILTTRPIVQWIHCTIPRVVPYGIPDKKRGVETVYWQEDICVPFNSHFIY